MWSLLLRPTLNPLYDPVKSPSRDLLRLAFALRLRTLFALPTDFCVIALQLQQQVGKSRLAGHYEVVLALGLFAELVDEALVSDLRLLRSSPPAGGTLTFTFFPLTFLRSLREL